jgi:hypothetical protein
METGSSLVGAPARFRRLPRDDAMAWYLGTGAAGCEEDGW